jgi:hypothetical protein
VHILLRGNGYEPTTAATAALTTLAASCPCFIRGPLVSRAFFVGGATALAGDLALLLATHRSKSATFFARSVHNTLLMIRSRLRDNTEVARSKAVRLKFKLDARTVMTSSSTGRSRKIRPK